MFLKSSENGEIYPVDLLISLFFGVNGDNSDGDNPGENNSGENNSGENDSGGNNSGAPSKSRL